MKWNVYWGYHVLQDVSRVLSRRQRLDLVSRTLRSFRLTDDDGISALFLGTTLPTSDLIVRHLGSRGVLLPPSITPEFLAERILSAFRDVTPAASENVEISCWDIDQ